MRPLPLIIAALVGWLEREQHDLIEFLLGSPSSVNVSADGSSRTSRRS